jgi:hypothetical protein
LTAQTARCVGTVANYTVSPAPTVGTITFAGDNAALWLDVYPLIGVFTPSLEVDANLICVDPNGATTCIGSGQAAEDPVLITTTGRPDQGSAVIRISDATSTSRADTPPDPGTQPQSAPPPNRQHHRRRHRHKHRRGHRRGR